MFHLNESSTGACICFHENHVSEVYQSPRWSSPRRSSTIALSRNQKGLIHLLYIHICICSIYVIFTYIYHKSKPNVGKYFIHGAYGTVRAATSPHPQVRNQDSKRCLLGFSEFFRGSPFKVRVVVKGVGTPHSSPQK